jgi:peptide/nickel transport system permease protein
MSVTQIAEPLGEQSSARPVESPHLFRRLMRNPLAVVCLAYLAVIAGIAIFAPIVLPEVEHEQAGDIFSVNSGPSWDHLLGTDGNGRDVLNRLLVGTRPTMIGVVEAVLVALALSVPIGLVAGYIGGWFDRAVTWWTDLMFSLPGIAIVLVVLAVFPQSMLAGMVALGVLAAPALARVIRSATLPVREELYIAAARASGLSRPYIIARHILPRIAGPVIVQASLFAAGALLAQGGLAYLGLIVPVPAPSWGGMIGEGIRSILLHPWLIWPPGIALTLTVLAYGLLGDAVRDITVESWSSTITRRSTRRRRSRFMNAQTVAESRPASSALLRVEGLTVAFPSTTGPVTVVDDVSFEIEAGEVVGLMGESGCGKTITAMSVLGLLPGKAQVVAGRISFNGRDLLDLSEPELRRVRGREISVISQEPMASLAPLFPVGWQIALSVRLHHGVSRRVARARTIELLRQVQLPDPELVARRYPHELSGGMTQRVAIARALAGEPKLLIADEPTTALDVTIQAEILELLRELQAERKMAIMLISHDWGVIADLCDRAVVMYAGEVVEQADLAAIFHQPLHPYTEALLAANPHYAPAAARLPTIPGSVPKPGLWPKGCHFHPRCTYATTACREMRIPIERPDPNRETRCIHHEVLTASTTAAEPIPRS